MQFDVVNSKQPMQSMLGMQQRTKETQQGASFDVHLNTLQTEQSEQKMTEMIDTIEKLKTTLEYDMSVENLMKYKQALTSFVDYYTKHELQVQDVLMTDRKGYTKKLQVVKTINEKLNDMTTNMLETNLGHLQMLKDINEIQGLVLNLYL